MYINENCIRQSVTFPVSCNCVMPPPLVAKSSLQQLGTVLTCTHPANFGVHTYRTYSIFMS